MSLLAPRLTKNSDGYYDLMMVNGSFVWASEGTAIAQHVLVRVCAVENELSLGNNLTTKVGQGTKLFSVVMSSETSQAEKELELKQRILGTPGVVKILSWQWDQTGHSATVQANIQTVYGEESVSIEVVPL